MTRAIVDILLQCIQCILQDHSHWSTDGDVPDLSFLQSGVPDCHGAWNLCQLDPYAYHYSVWNPGSQKLYLEGSTCTCVSETDLWQ